MPGIELEYIFSSFVTTAMQGSFYYTHYVDKEFEVERG